MKTEPATFDPHTGLWSVRLPEEPGTPIVSHKNKAMLVSYLDYLENKERLEQKQSPTAVPQD